MLASIMFIIGIERIVVLSTSVSISVFVNCPRSRKLAYRDAFFGGSSSTAPTVFESQIGGHT